MVVYLFRFQIQIGFLIVMNLFKTGEMAEWLKAQHWKCCLEFSSEGSNPSLSIQPQP